MSSIEGLNKTRILRFVSLMPGIHLRELQRLLGISFNSTRYHVSILSHSGKIISSKERGFLRLYPAGTKESDREVYSLLRNATSRTILTTLIQKSGMTNKQICEITGLAKSTVSEHLGRFLDTRIARTTISEKSGMVYELENPGYLLQLLMNTERKIFDRAANSFIDLWIDL